MMNGFILGSVWGCLFFFFFVGLVWKWNAVWYRGRGLPPGAMGWALLGETREFIMHGATLLKNKRARHGNIFKSHLFGWPTVVSTDADVNRFVLTSEGKGISPGYPQSFSDLLGPWNISAVHGSLHKAMRTAFAPLFGPSTIRMELLPKLDSLVRSQVAGWSGQTLDIQKKLNEMAILTALKLIIGKKTGNDVEILEKEFDKLAEGLVSIPINLPCTSYGRALKARVKIVSILSKIVEERRRKPLTDTKDVLSSLLSPNSKLATELSDSQMIDLIIGIIHASHGNVVSTHMMTLKYLHDHPRALKEIRDEHLEIRKRKSLDEAINWEDYKSMTFTRAVILEAMRVTPIINGFIRKASKELVVKGSIIPKGWKILVYLRDVNHDPILYTEPLRFNPWRWIQDKNLESHPNFTLFGAGNRVCLGKELAMTQISLFLHYFLTNYRQGLSSSYIVSVPLE